MKESSWSTAASATLHCLTGCAIGEILGMVLATAWQWGNLASILLSVLLAFAWTACPYTTFALESNTNDSLVSLVLVCALYFLSSPPVRGGLIALAVTYALSNRVTLRG